MNLMLSITFLIITICFLALVNKFADKMKKNQFITAMIVIVSVGAILRTLAIIYIPCKTVSDYNTMFSAAKNFAVGGRPFVMGSYFQRFPHMTTYSVFCGFLMKIFGQSLWVIKIFNVVFKTVAIYAAALVGNELLGRKGMLSAAFLYAVFPADIFYTSVAATENYALTLLVFSLLFYIKAYKCTEIKATLKDLAFCGLLLSFGCLLRGVAPFYLAAYFAGILFVFKGIRRKILSIVSLFLVYFVIFQSVSLMLFYTGITEYKLTDKGEPYIVYMLVGSNFETNGMYSSEDHGVYLEADENPDIASEIAKERLVERLVENKEKIIPLWIKKTDIIWSDASFNGIYWSMYENGMDTDNPFAYTAEKLAMTMYRFLLIMTFFAVVFYKERRLTFMLALLPLAFEGGLMLIEIQPRYTFSVAYIFILFAVVGFHIIYEYTKRLLKKS